MPLYTPEQPTAQQPSLYDKLLNGLLGKSQNYGGLLSAEDQQSIQQQKLLSLGASMLQASGPSPYRTSVGQALGQGLGAAQQAGQQGSQDMLQSMLLRTKIAKAAQGTPTNLQKEYEYAKANGFTGSPEDWKKVASAQPQTPAAIQQYEYWNKLPTQAEKDAYLTVQRNMQPFQVADMAGGKVVFNRATGNYEQATTAGQEASGAGQIAQATAGGKTTGEAVATAQLDLPRVKDNARQALKTLDDFEKHPGFKYVFGWDSVAPTIPGSSQAGALSYYDQIKGKTFLEAFNSLKGAGQITEIEGSKATDAIARLNRAQSENDAKVAMADLREVIQAGLLRAEKKAGAPPAAAPKRVRVDAQGNVIGN